MNLKIYLCDDEHADMEVLQSHLTKYAIQHDENYSLSMFSSGRTLLADVHLNQCNVVFLDIEMPETDGLLIAQCIRQSYNPNMFIIFTTSYPQYMQDSFEVQPFQFLTKPVSYEKVERLMNSIHQRIQKASHSTIVVDEEGEEHFVPLGNLVYISNEKNNKGVLSFHLADGTIYSKGSLSYYEELLKGEGFVSPARGILLNVKFIKSFNGARVMLKDGGQVEVSRRKAKELQKMYANHIINILE